MPCYTVKMNVCFTWQHICWVFQRNDITPFFSQSRGFEGLLIHRNCILFTTAVGEEWLFYSVLSKIYAVIIKAHARCSLSSSCRNFYSDLSKNTSYSALA